jgi:adenylate kinase
MFRAAIAQQTEVGMRAKSYMDRGEYVPDGVVIDLIRERLSKDDCKSGFILDGFPRTEPQAKALNELLLGLEMSLDAIFYFDLAKEILVDRLSSRRTCRNCNRIITVDQIASASAASNCVKTGGACDFYQRSDDAPEVVRKRIEVYESQTSPIVGFYSGFSGFLKVNGAASPDQVFSVLNQALKKA